MNEAEAQIMLKALTLHYGEPVMPVSRYCHKLEQWVGIMRAKHPQDRYDLISLLITVRKSNLLARMIYGNEEPRTVQCPEHKGEWQGIFPEPCPHGCQHTGWLPNV